MQRTISFSLNGKPARVTTDDERKLLWVLRYDLGLTGTKFGCGADLSARARSSSTSRRSAPAPSLSPRLPRTSSWSWERCGGILFV